MPPYGSNEARPTRFVSRRELGHGKLAEKAIRPILPNEEDFPYTIRLVTEILSSNWSTSMAAVCSSTLSLMDAWVPIKAPVSGIAMGIVTEWNNYKILTDIQWLEDFTWDMDFKVTWSKNWITALQMDMKIKWLKVETLKEAIHRADIGRWYILDFMLSKISEPRKEMSPYAPKITKIDMTNDQIRAVIWPGGSVIQEIIKETWAKIDFKDDKLCIITATNNESSEQTLKRINEIIWEPTVWEIIDGEISRVEDYWVFVKIWWKKVWLCHVKNLSKGFMSDVKTKFKVWEKLRVKILSIDPKDGKIQLQKEI